RQRCGVGGGACGGWPSFPDPAIVALPLPESRSAPWRAPGRPRTICAARFAYFAGRFFEIRPGVPRLTPSAPAPDRQVSGKGGQPGNGPAGAVPNTDELAGENQFTRPLLLAY